MKLIVNLFFTVFVFTFSFGLFAQNECPAEMTLFHRSTGPLNKSVDKPTFKKWHRKDRSLETSNMNVGLAINEKGQMVEIFKKKKKGRAYLFNNKGVLLSKTKFSLKHKASSGKFIPREVVSVGNRVYFLSYIKNKKLKEFLVYAQEFNVNNFEFVSKPFLISRIGFLGNWGLEQLYIHQSEDKSKLFIGHNSGGKKGNQFRMMVVDSVFDSYNYQIMKLGKKGFMHLNEVTVSNQGHIVFNDYKKNKVYAAWPNADSLLKYDLKEENLRVSAIGAQVVNNNLYVSGSLTGHKKYDGLDGVFLTLLHDDGDHDNLVYKKLSKDDLKEIMTEEELAKIRDKKEVNKSKKKKKKKKKQKKKKKKKKKKKQKYDKNPIPELRNGIQVRGIRKVGDTYVLDTEVYYWYVVVTRTDKTVTYTYYYVYKDIFLFGFDAESGEHKWSERIEKYRQTVNDNGIKGGYLVHHGGDQLDFMFVVRPNTLGEDVKLNECEPDRDIFEPKDNRKNQERFIIVSVDEDGEKTYYNYGDVYKKLHNLPVLDPIINDQEECRFYLPAYHYLKLRFEEE